MYAIRAKDKEGDRIMPFFNIAAAYVKQSLDGGGKWFWLVCLLKIKI